MEVSLDAIEFKPIGLIRTQFTSPKDMPIQPAGAQGIPGTIELFPEYAAGLKDLEGFSHVILLYHFNRVKQSALVVTPFMDDKPHGIFATRMPARPNPIGLSVVRLIGVEGNILHIENVDVLDSTPLLDIKPYVADYDIHPCDRQGWLSGTSHNVITRRSDGRFG
jgi:tRNA-Thr(GGU) m(6)t(6)A37 methyltransferase TsaA